MTTNSGSATPEENVPDAGVGRGATPSPASSELTGGEGYTYEDVVAGVYAVALLCETTAPGLPGRTVTKLSLQQGAFGEPLDDVVVDGVAPDSTTARLSLQVKRSLVVSGADSNVDFRETILRAHATLARPGFRRTVDRVGVVTGEISDGRKRIFEALCEWARTSVDAPSFIRKVRSDEHRSALDAVRSILAGSLPEAALDEAEHLLLSHFVLMRFEMLHEGSVTEASTVASLADHLHATERHRADDLWRRILALVRVSQGRAGEFDRKSLVARMNGAFHLGGAPSLRGNLAHLSEDARLATAEIANGIGGVNIARPRFIVAAHSALEQHRFVQLGGLAGTGKSAVLRALIEEQLERGPVLFLKADRLTGSSWSQYATSMGLERCDLDALLVELAAAGTSILFIDGLDRVEVSHRGVVVDVVNTILDSPLLGNWKVLATVRDTGLEPLRTWLPGGLMGETGTGVVDVLPLDDAESRVLAERVPGLLPLLFGTKQVREIVRRPFFAEVLCQRRRDDSDSPSSEVDLATAWWNGGGYGAIAARAGQRRNMLVAMAKAGASTLGRRIRSLDLNPVDLAELEADGIIKSVREGHIVRFTHDIYFEWSFLQLLISEGQGWLQVIRQSGEPPVLGRTVELLSQTELVRGEDWAEHLARLEGVGDVRSQWLRAWMIGPFGSPAFEARQTPYDAAMLTEGGKRVAKLAMWFQAEKTRANPVALDGSRFPDLSPVERMLLADSIAWPSDVDAWRRCCTWLLGHMPVLPARARPDALAMFEVWQNCFADVPNPVSNSIVELSRAWLRDIEDRFHSRQFQRDKSEWDTLKSGEVDELEQRLRGLLLRAARAYSDIVGEYLSSLQAMERLPRGAIKQIYDYGPILGEVQPKRLADLILHQMSRALPTDVARRHADSLHSRGFHPQDWQSLAIDDEHSFFPPAPTREPFASLFRLSADEGRRVVRELANHAVTAWRQLHRLDHGNRDTPIPLVLTFPWGRQMFWGNQQVYVWSRGSWGPHAVASGLMALEAWAFEQVQRGRPVDDVIHDVLDGHKSAAALGVAA